MFKRFGLERFLMNEGGAPAAGGGGATPPAAPPAASPAASPAPSDWTSGLNDDFKGFVQTKGFKDPQSALESYRNLEKLMGAPRERLLTIPEKDDDKVGWDNVHSRLGRPADPKEYKFELSPEAATPEFNDFIRNAFHELGITKKQGETLMTKYGEFFGQEVSKTHAEMQVQSDNQAKALKKEWGGAYDQNLQVAKNAATAFGFDGVKIDAMEAALGYDGVMKFLHDLGTKIGPHQFISGGNSNGGKQAFTPAGAQARIKELKADASFVSRYTKGDIEAKKEMEMLHSYAYPTEQN